MSTKAQVKANKKNAKKSTGPKTPKGKAKSSQNATKHGLFARKTVILNENPEEFDLFHRQMLEDLTPQGAMQLVFAERIIDLAWRLKRCQSIQNQAIDEMIKEKRMNTYYRIIDGGFDDKRNTDDLLVGQAVIRDFRTSQVLERLMKYEQQIEKSLYKNMKELKALQKETQHASRTTQFAPREQNEPNPQVSRIQNRESIVSPPIHSAGSHPNMENPQSQGEPIKRKTNPISSHEPRDTLHASQDANLQNEPNPQPRATSDESRSTKQVSRIQNLHGMPHGGESSAQNEPNSHPQATSNERKLMKDQLPPTSSMAISDHSQRR